VIYDRIRKCCGVKKTPMPEFQRNHQLDAVALDHHPRHGDAGFAGCLNQRLPSTLIAVTIFGVVLSAPTLITAYRS
jgi:hypothetical protein